MPTIDSFLGLGERSGCSDVHLTVGLPPMLRIDGELITSSHEPLEAVPLDDALREILDAYHGKILEETGAVDLSYRCEHGRFRANIFHQHTGLCAAFRRIPTEAPRLRDLGLPRTVSSLVGLSSGLVLVTGSTGTGKTTTLAALIDEINRSRRAMIITLEDPVEFVHTSRSAVVIQREIGTHMPTYASGLRAALREDPDVILVGELRDRESIVLALEAAETGHLVFGTLHTRSAAKTIDRILDIMPPDEHAQVRTVLADNLKCVLSQELVRVARGEGRRAAVEVMMVTPALAQHVREGTTHQLETVITTGKKHGMQLMDDALLAMVRAGEIDPDEAFRYATHRREFVPFVTSATSPTAIAAALSGSKEGVFR